MGILDRKFRYVPADKTDIRRTFRRVRRELKLEAARRLQQQAKKPEPASNVAPLKRGGRHA